MSAAGWPEAVLFDPSDVSRSELRSRLPADPDAPVLIVAAGAAEDWQRVAALAVADALSLPDRRVLLVDLHVPSRLAAFVGAPPGDGLDDVLSFGSSLEHAALQPPGHAFDFVGPGAGAASAEELAADPAWPALLRRLTAQQRRVVLFLPASAVPDWPDAQVVLLAPPDHPVDGAAPLLWLAPVEAPAQEAEEADAFERLRVPRDAEREAYIAEKRRAQPTEEPAPEPTPAGAETAAAAAPGAPAAPSTSAEPKRHLSEPVVTRPRRRALERGTLAWTAGIVLLVSLLAGVWHFFVRDRSAVGETVVAPADSTAAVPAAAADTTPAPVALPYSVQIEAHDDLPTAQSRVQSLSAADSTVGYFLTPVLVGGTLYYRLMAGPVEDSAAAAMLMARLVAQRQKTAAAARDIKRAPLSFLLGAYDTREQAEREQRRLLALDVPSFILESPSRRDGVWRLYSGVYAGLAEADVMGEMLRDAGVSDSLVTLTGGSP